MFSGAYEHSVDDKGRTVIPARFRAKLGEKFFMTRGLNGCLWVFSERVWPQVQQRLTPKSFLDTRGIKLERYFLGAASECVPDKQGRVQIPAILMEHANIKEGDSVWTVGLTDKLEIWSKDRWDQYNANLESEIIADLDMDVGLIE